MSKKPDEEKAIALLVEHLRQKNPQSRIEHEDEPHDPPDYWLTIDDSRFAVEITSIHDRPPALPSKTPTPISYSSSWGKFEETLRREGRDRDLREAYFIFRGATPDLTIHGRELHDRILDHVRRTQDQGQPVSETVFGDRQDFIEISRISDSAEFSVETGTVMFDAGRRIGDHLSQLASTMETKCLKMQDRLAPECCGVILVIWDDIKQVTPQEWSRDISQMKAVQWYHSVFMILRFLEREKCWFAWTSDSAWRD